MFLVDCDPVRVTCLALTLSIIIVGGGGELSLLGLMRKHVEVKAITAYDERKNCLSDNN